MPQIDADAAKDAAKDAGAKALGALGNIGRMILSNRIATVIVAVVLVFAVGGIFDTVANWGKAYGNVTVNGIDVGGKTAEEIDELLRSTLGPQVSQAQVRVYANDEAQQAGAATASETEAERLERLAQAEQISAEEAAAKATSWSTNALALKAEVPYESIVQHAVSYGRDEGGFFSRFGLFFSGHDVPVMLTFDPALLDAFTGEIDKAIGDPRIDTTVAINEGVATPVAGHDGMMVDRDWIATKISSALLSNEQSPSFVAVATEAPSRITMEQAQRTSDGINRALQAGGVFVYKGSEWAAGPVEIGQWTRVGTVQNDNGFDLGVHIDEAAAFPAVMKGAGATVKSDSLTVKFVEGDNGIVVRTFGPGNIPEVAPAVEQLNEGLFGEGGIAKNASAAASPVRVEITESDAPAALMLDQAIELGIVTVIGEYTTEFSNDEGTENRNHNIKLAADILNNSIVKAGGGKWDFNERSGDTNEAAGFWAAGSIVNGEYVDSIGGGICQVATTIFNAVFESGLPVNTRFNHTLYIASYPTGRDAAVSYPDLTLAWTNDTTSDVLLSMSYTDTTVTARLYSVHTGYTVQEELGEWQEGAKYKVKFEEDEDLAKGDSYVKTSGVDGSIITVTRYVRNEAGQVVSEQLFESRYDAKDEVVVVGPGTDTKKLERDTSESSESRQNHEGDGEGQPATEDPGPQEGGDEVYEEYVEE